MQTCYRCGNVIREPSLSVEEDGKVFCDKICRYQYKKEVRNNQTASHSSPPVDENLSLWGYYYSVFKKYTQFDGRSRRKEFWVFVLINNVIGFLLGLAGGLLSNIIGDVAIVPLYLYCAFVIIPFLAVSVRRLHDTNRSGWFALLAFLPLIGFILFVFLIQDSQPDDNEYGPNPKGILA